MDVFFVKKSGCPFFDKKDKVEPPIHFTTKRTEEQTTLLSAEVFFCLRPAVKGGELEKIKEISISSNILKKKFLNNFWNIYSKKFIMRDKKHIYQKYQKKYFFFQKSFFDFLYWRSTKKRNDSFSIQGPSSRLLSGEKKMHFNSINKFSPFEQEKMSFDEYWKSSEQKTIENTLKISTKFTSLKPSVYSSSGISDGPKSFEVLFTEKKSISPAFFEKKRQTQKSGGGWTRSAEQRQKGQKKTKSFVTSNKSLQFLTTQKFHLLFLKKRKEKMLNRQNKNFKNESFLPVNSSFEISQNFDFFKSQKIGEFFPKKKNFQQYWLFPFLGVLFFFSQNASSLFLQKEKKFQNNFSFQPFQIMNTVQGRKFLPEQTGSSMNFALQNKNLNFQKSEKNKIQSFEYSFSQKNFTKTQFFQNLEKREYEEFLKFYTKIFQNTLFASDMGSFAENPNFFFRPSKQSSGDGENSAHHDIRHSSAIALDKVELQQSFQNKLEVKRNCFRWKWFSVNSNFLNNPQSILSFSSQIPQKAEFFVKNPFVFKQSVFSQDDSSQKINFKQKPSTPLFDYSKNLFLVDELKRDFSFLTLENIELDDKKTNFPFFKTHEIQKFFINQASSELQHELQQKEEFLSSFSPGQMSTFDPFLQNSFQPNNSHEEKNLFFLKKWSKTHKFSTPQLSLHAPFLNKKSGSTLSSPGKGHKLPPFLLKTERQNFYKAKISKKLKNLDTLYFQKLFKNLSLLYGHKKLQKQFSLENIKNEHKHTLLEQRFQKFFYFKKHTFGFFTFQHYKKNYKKFLYSFLSFHKKYETKKAVFCLQTLKKNEQAQSFHKIIVSKNLENTLLFKFHHPILFQFFIPEKSFQKLNTKSFFKISEKPFSLYNQGNEIMKLKANTNLYPHNFSSQNFHDHLHPSTKWKSGLTLSSPHLLFHFVDGHLRCGGEADSLFPQFEQKKGKDFLFLNFGNSQNQKFSFQFSKFNFFEKFQENFYNPQNLNNFFSNIYKYQSFQKNFLIETSKFQKPFVFQRNHFAKVEKWTAPQTQKNGNAYGEKKENESPEHKNFVMTSRFFILKSKKRFSFLQYENQNKGIQSNFSGFSKKQRKFEKTFRAFFSPLKHAKNHFSVPPHFFITKSGPKQNEKIFTKKKKDFFFLQSLSLLLKKNPQNFSFYIPTNQKVLKTRKQENQNLNSFVRKKETKLANSFKNLHTREKNRLSPQLLLKRDGFLFFPTEQKQPKEKKNFNFQRLEKEKSFQKKRRLKKEKLETRRRKKRKRFFPRPVWLRMNLYKKFLKTRHSQKLFSSFSLKHKKMSLEKNWNTFSTTFLRGSKKEKKADQITEKKQLNKYFLKKFQKKTTSDFQNYDVDSLFFKKQNSTFQSKTYQKNSLFPLKKEIEFGPHLLYRKADGGQNPGSKVSKNIDHYKISNDIYQEFLRLSWKSSWFQNNFKPYTRTIQENFQKIQSIESQKSFSNFYRLIHPQDINSLFFFQDSPFFSEQSRNNFLVKKSVLQKFSWYSNVQNSFSSQNILHFSKNTSSFLQSSPDGSKNVFSSLHSSEYNRLLYARISDILKKLKFSENTTNDSFFESLKVNRRKSEKIFSASKNSFFTKTALFFEKFQVPSQPVIPAFSVFSSLFHDSSVKPTGDIPTLRAMWAFQKTNFSQFQERNSIQNLWAFQKRKNSFHSFKGTKKIMNFLRKSNAFEKFKTPQQFSSDWSLFVLPKYKTKKSFFNNGSVFSFPNGKKEFSFAKILKNQKKKNFMKISKGGIASSTVKTSFLASKKGDFLPLPAFLNTLDTMTLKKFQNIEKKSSVFGIQSFKQNSKISYRYFKYHLSPFYQNQKKLSHSIDRHFDGSKSTPLHTRQDTRQDFVFFCQKKADVQADVDEERTAFVLNKEIQLSPLFSPKLFKNKNPQNSAKSSLNFWWAQKPFQNFDFLGTSQFRTLQNFSNTKPFSLDFVQKDDSFLNKMNSHSKEKFTNIQTLQHNFVFSNISFLLLGAFFFHFAIFYTLFKIPEIRSVFKFTFLIFSKFWNSFFVVFFSIYNLFKRYTKNGLNLLKSSSSFSKNKTIHPSLQSHQQNQGGKKSSPPLQSKRLRPDGKTDFVEMNPVFSEKQLLNSFFHKADGKMAFQNYVFQNTFSPQGRSKNSNTPHQAKLNDFVFEFFPRFSVFSLSQQKLFPNLKPFSIHQKNEGYFFQSSNSFSTVYGEKNDFYFQSSFGLTSPPGLCLFLSKKGGSNQNNFKQVFSQTKILKNFDSAFLFKTSQNEFFSPKILAQTLFSPSLQRKIEKSTHFHKVISVSRDTRFSDTQAERKLSKTEKNLSQFALSFLVFGKHILFVPYRIFKLGESLFTKIFEILEGIFYAFYKFLEKPAEFMIEFIAFVFLIEWSSDILGFFPDSIETSMWKSSQKLLRPVRTGTFFLSFGIFFLRSALGTSPKTFSKDSPFLFQTAQNFSLSQSGFSPFQFLFSTGFFQFSNFAAYVLQKRLFYVFENVPSILLQPDIDILVRQRKGILFWDIWAEILLKAAEKYNVNLPSFVTLKEEQELFIEKLVRDSQFFESFDLQHSQKTSTIALDKVKLQKRKGFPAFSKGNNENSLIRELDSISGKTSENIIHESQQNSTKSFSSFLQNFVIQNRPVRFFDFYFLSQNDSFFQKEKNIQKLQQFSISNLFSDRLGLKTQIKNEKFFASPPEQSGLFRKGGLELSAINFFSLLGPESKNFHSLQAYRNIGKEVSVQDSFHSFQNIQKVDHWECNQYATFQSQETDFFLDIYPPKSLKHVHFLKYYEPAHYTLGSFICQIYAGIFPKQVSKNILVVGESGTAKTFFLRALAGETEMKIITENASRYAVVQRGVAVGMKYLRDVFDAIALQTPCFFVMEDLHIIGSKRPFMISENENTQNGQSSFGLEQQEVHETNQMIYQSSRHSISDFRRPYKGDFSMGIPTNYFLQTFYSPFFSSRGNQIHGGQDSFFYPFQKGHQFQNSQFFGGNFSSSVWNSLSSPLPIDSLEAALQNTGIQEKEKSNFESFYTQKNAKKIQSHPRSGLQFSKEQIFAPPATSPFTVLMMKEQNKLKPKKIVQETSWGGLSADQILLYQKESSSIRAKIAVLAEKTLNLSRGKFDMITDFLVIIDSVRSNRGFVVFGTTHKPSSLDPALRRPGRFDETLSLSRTPNFLNRFEIFKMNLENSVSTFDFFDSSILTENFSEMDLFDILSQTKLSFFHNYKYGFQKSLPLQVQRLDSSLSFFDKKRQSSGGKAGVLVSLSGGNAKNWVSSQFKQFSPGGVDDKSERNQIKSGGKVFVKKQLYSQTSPTKAFHALLKSPIFEDFYTQKQFTLFSSQAAKSKNFLKNSKFALRNSNVFFDERYTLLPKGPSHMLSLAYSKLGVFLSESNLLHDPTSFVPLKLDIDKNSSRSSNFQQYYGNVFFDPVPHFSTPALGMQANERKNQKNSQLMVFLSGKVAEFFICSSDQKNLSFCNSGIEFSSSSMFQTNEQNVSPRFARENSSVFEKPFSLFSEKFGIFESSFENVSAFNKKSTNFTFVKKSLFSTMRKSKMNISQVQKSALLGKKDFYWTVYGNEESWRSATPFLSSLIQKRFLFTKNLLLSKMLFFENMDQRRKPPNPPGSSILMPSKKYENFKRTEADFFQKAHFSIHEKIQMHQKQRFLKQLYNVPVETYFRSELRKNHKTLFSSSFQEFAYLDSFVQKSSSSHSYYKKYIQVRHRFSNVNQWWNGMFPEHTRETTYLSDVDWRTMFVSSLKIEKTNSQINVPHLAEKIENSKKSSLETFEFLMDFPDAEQYYNPRNRRWFFKSNFQFIEKTSTNSSFWSIFEKDLQYEIFSHYLMESFYQSFSYFEKKREMLDFFAFHLLYKGFLKEFDFLTTFSRFKK